MMKEPHHHYAAPSRFTEINKRARKAIEKTILEHGMKYQEVITWSTDGFFVKQKKRLHTGRQRDAQ